MISSLDLSKVGKSFKMIPKIGEGAFCQVYQTINTRTNREVAVKMEHIETGRPQIIYELKVYQYLHNDPTVVDKGIPNIYYAATEGTSPLTEAISTSSSWTSWDPPSRHSSMSPDRGFRSRRCS
jgi:serine/threonine protein kinase